MQRRFYFTLFCLLLLPGLASAATVAIGDSYNDVILALGDPDGELSAGSKQILSYGKAQVILRDKKVSSISKDFDRLMQERASNQAALAKKRDANLVNYRGKWVTAAQREQLIRSETAKQNANRNATRISQPNSGVAWLTDFQKATQLAQAENKKILINFTGSDWCGWCIKLEREVFSKQEFMNYAREHYVLVKCDFPKGTKLPASLEQQNKALAKKYKVRGFPTIVVLKASGKLHTTGGYVKGGPSAFLNSIR